METYNDRFVREDECRHITGLSKATRWRMEQKGDFPTRIKIGNRIAAWRLSHINQWLDRQCGRNAAL